MGKQRLWNSIFTCTVYPVSLVLKCAFIHSLAFSNFPPRKLSVKQRLGKSLSLSPTENVTSRRRGLPRVSKDRECENASPDDNDDDDGDNAYSSPSWCLPKLPELYTLRRPVMREVLSTIIWGVPPAGGPLL